MPAVLLGALGLSASFAAVAGLPFFSEAHNHLGVGADMRAWWSAFDPARVPLRPLQFLPFQLIARMEEPGPLPIRALAYLLHAGSAWMVALLARRFGAGALGAALAAAVFLCAPNVKSLAWTAAIGSPGRVFCLLAALVLFGDPRRRAASGVLGVLALLCGLAFHQSAVVLAPLLVLLAWTAAGPPEGSGTGRSARALLLRPAVVVALGLVAAYLVYFVCLRTERGHDLRGLAGLPANVVKGAFALAPEGLRLLAVDGFRGLLGGAGYVLAGALTLALGAASAWLAVRGAPATRFAVLGVAVDAVLPVLTSGYGQRYAYLGSALVAVACGCAGEAAWRGRARTRMRGGWVLAAVLFLAGAWLADQVRDTRELREAGRAYERVLDGLALERERHEQRVRGLPGVQAPIVLVDFPDMWGRERDLPLFNWGLDLALARRGIPGPWVLLRTRPFSTSSTFLLAAPGELERLLESPRARVLGFDPVRLEPAPWVELEARRSAQAGG